MGGADEGGGLACPERDDEPKPFDPALDAILACFVVSRVGGERMKENGGWQVGRSSHGQVWVGGARGPGRRASTTIFRRPGHDGED